MKKFCVFLKKRHYLPLKIIIVIIVLIVCATCAMSYFKGNVLTTVLTLSEATVKAMAVDAINNAAHLVIDANTSYSDLVKLTMDAQGNLQFIQTDTVKINRLVRELANMCQANISQISDSTLQLPLGAFTGSLVLSGMGPNINIALMPVGSVLCDFMSTFEEVGINQTRHSIYININTTIALVLPVSSLPVYTTTTILICENIIVGKVPEVYLNSPEAGDIIDLIPSR